MAAFDPGVLQVKIKVEFKKNSGHCASGKLWGSYIVIWRL
jgi:hypothetical protein